MQLTARRWRCSNLRDDHQLYASFTCAHRHPFANKPCNTHIYLALVRALLASPRWIAFGALPPPTAKTAVTSSPSHLVASLSPMYPSFLLRLLPIYVPPCGLRVLLLHLVIHSSGVSIILAVSPLPSRFPPVRGVVLAFRCAAMQFLNSHAEAALASSAAGTDVTKAAFI
jgi:hypothetical protein